MLLLAVDTSGRKGSMALARVAANENDLQILEEVPLAGGTFSAQFVPQLSVLLSTHRCAKSDLGGLVVVTGPGSFTGLRVGLAAIKAMAEILRRPVGAISLLEAVARSGARKGRVFSVLDAGRGDLYVGDYELGPPVRLHSEHLLSREEFFAENKAQLVLTSEAKIVEEVRSAGFQVELVGHPRSGEIARIGWQRIQSGETILPENLEANYIRRSDSEIFSKPKA